MSQIFSVIDRKPLIFNAIRFDAAIPKNARRFFIKTSFFLWLITGLMLAFYFTWFFLSPTLFFHFDTSIGLKPPAYLSIVDINTLTGIFILVSGLFLFMLFLEFFYIASLRPSPVLSKDGETYSVDYDTARAFWHAAILDGGSISARAFWRQLSKYGILNSVLYRIGLADQDLKDFVKDVGDYSISRDDLMLAVMSSVFGKKTRIIGFAEFSEAIFAVDKNFEKFLFDRKLHWEELRGAASWMSRVSNYLIAREFIWEKSNLARIPGIGKNFGFGYTFELDKHSRDLTGRGAPMFLGPHLATIETIENILSKSNEANVLLVADEGEGRHTILEGLALMIAEGRAHPAVEHKRMVLVDFASLTALAKTKGNFEALVKNIMSESVRAGNVILALDDLPQAIESAEAIGADFLGLIEPYIAGPEIQIIAVSDRRRYHDRVEKIGKIAGLFTRVEPGEFSSDSMVAILEEAVLVFERRYMVFFTYQALLKIYDSAELYIAEGVMPEKAVLLLDEAGATFADRRGRIVTAEDVEAFVAKKTGIPIALAGEKEKELLLNLEEIISKRIIGQDEAVGQIAEALRKVRSGLGSKNRPIGSFLFLGPTGVGKTETAKVLADVYFGGVNSILRFDMSEFQGSDGLTKLIGRSGGQDGVLTSKIHEHPFGLVLLDEIEKASLDVLNLFLQILDEGFFSDASGKRISMKETMIIATSNAAAGVVMDLVRGGDNPAENKTVIIEAVRREGKFSPELLNRFDAIVIYHPLNRRDLIKVAKLMLEELLQKLKKQDIFFEITDELADFVSRVGYDPSYGARPMRRVIDDRIEGVIAKKILSGALKRGDKFSFSAEDISKL